MREMTVREAIAELGPTKVRSAMVSFRARQDKAQPFRTCFLGRALGKPGSLYQRCDDLRCEFDKALGISRDALEVIWREFDDSPSQLRREALLYLAEHGTAHESSVTLAEPSHV